MRRAHILKPNHSSETPHCAVWFDTETVSDPEWQGEGERQVLKFGWAAYRRIERGKWTAPEWYRFTDIDLFWEWVRDKCRAKTRLYMFCHNAAFDAPVVDAFGRQRADGWTLNRAIVDSPPVVLGWRKDNRTILLVDTLNIWRMPLASIGAQVGLPKLNMPAPTAPAAEWDEYGKRDTEIIMEACLRWWTFLKDHDMGGFAVTLAAQAMRAFRHRFMPLPILIDSDERAAALSRDALHGGRTECFRLGKIEGGLTVLDINSQYPAVMKSEPMPYKLALYTHHATPLDIVDWLRGYCIVADVEIETRNPAYGLVHDGRLIFPVGRFRTSLCTPELARAAERGELIKVHRAAVYHAAPLFHLYVDYLYALRLERAAAGDTVTAWQAKILLNSLFGKFGQRGRVYDTIGTWPDDSIEVWEEIDADTGQTFKMRRFAGVVQQIKDEPEARDSFPAIAAHVTAHARLMLWGLIEKAGRDEVYYCDTDSLFCSRRAVERLRDHIDPTALGSLKVVSHCDAAELFGPKDYLLDSKRVAKGVKSKAEWIAADTVRQPQFSTLIGNIRSGDLSAPIVRTVEKHLHREYKKGTLRGDGSIAPFVLNPA